jgi:hypothetical protein
MIIFSSEFLIAGSSAVASLSVSMLIPSAGTISPSLPSNYDFVFKINGSGGYEAISSNGSVVYSSTNASFVFNYVMASGQTFFVEPGNYYLTAPILLHSNVTFVGSGIDTTNFDVAADMSYYTGIDWVSGVFDNDASSNSNITLDGFTINGNSPTYMATGIWLENVNYFTLDNVKVNGTYAEALIVNQEYNPTYNNTNYVINNVQTYGCGLVGGDDTSDSLAFHCVTDFSITNIFVNVTGSSGIIVTNQNQNAPEDQGENCSNGLIANCSVYSSQATNDFTLNYCQNLTLENLYAYGAYNHNYDIESSSNVSIQNITSNNSGDHGIHISGCQGIMAYSLVSYNSGQITPGDGVGIFIQDSSNCTFNNSQSNSNLLMGWLITTITVGCSNINLVNCTGINNVANDGLALYSYFSEITVNETFINGGNFSGNGAYGIEITNTVMNTQIMDVNYGAGNTKQNILNDGTNTLIT